MFYDNYIRLCNSIEKSPSAVAVEIGIAKPTVNRWKNGSCPTDATLEKIANYFGVSKDELIGTDNKKTPTQSGERDNLLLKVMNAFDTADDPTREVVLRVLGLK